MYVYKAVVSCKPTYHSLTLAILANLGHCRHACPCICMQENPTQKEGETEDTVENKREEGDEEAVDMTQEFGGEVEDLPGGEEDEESSHEEEEEDYEKEMGDLGQENSDQVDRNMWAPEEEQQEEVRTYYSPVLQPGISDQETCKVHSSCSFS